MATLTFRDTTIPAIPGRDVLGQLLDAGADIGYICMAGSCGTCKVTVRNGGEHLAPAEPAERHFCARHPGTRLACQAVTLGTGDVIVDQ